ncbi:MAG: hypothetical protein SWY16_04775 [Cyanobacteriota bacterium]|nr:hypothetical protein [Cyanobacteriota bacterium]
MHVARRTHLRAELIAGDAATISNPESASRGGARTMTTDRERASQHR